jgi:hypothetical protein
VKYLIMIYSNPASRAAWETMSDDERRELGRGHARLGTELAEAGVLVASEGLPDPGEGVRLPAVAGALPSDGPFAEAKEYLAGFYLVECTDLDEAVAIAARVPDAKTNTVEVRPAMELFG